MPEMPEPLRQFIFNNLDPGGSYWRHEALVRKASDDGCRISLSRPARPALKGHCLW